MKPDTKKELTDAIKEKYQADYQAEYDRLRKTNSAFAKAQSLAVKAKAEAEGFTIR